MRALGSPDRHEMGRWLNNWPRIHACRSDDESVPHTVFRRIESLQKIVSVHASFHNHFNSKCHLVYKETFKARSRWSSGRNLRHNDLNALPLNAPRRDDLSSE